ncbi:UvrD-helicase domain-containing protein [Streptomyces sp. NA04227]|uniref:UvrD-helicase domain-containing protein n=1 Tax=Streptomyces sp. NA04227 TaxID=2742136 RepID=UPI0015926C27|nr:UvrD-helicase domain-containing protein [Streptomyces sp. NA04227]QKW09011.1 UvrD-helicase domain-containing protein [Streptomyces sp. NA04227]
MSSSSSTRRLPHPGVRRGESAYRLVRTPPTTPGPPEPDASQRAVVDHRHGPLLVLAGPGTGKTTTLVEAVHARIAQGTDPERMLVLTFSRRAAVELRDRIALRTGAAAAPQATTFHSFCYALVRAHQDSELFRDPLRLLSGPEQDVAVRELLAGQIDLARSGLATIRWPDELRACLTTRGFADEVRAVLARSRELGLGPRSLESFARRAGRPDWTAAAAFLAEYLDVLDMQGVLDYAELVHRAVLLAERPEVAARLTERYEAVYVDEYQDTDPAQVRLLRALVGESAGALAGAGNAGNAGSVGRAGDAGDAGSAVGAAGVGAAGGGGAGSGAAGIGGGGGVPGAGSGGRALVAFGDPDQSIYAFRGADVNGILDFPQMFPRPDGCPAPVRVLGTSRRAPAGLLAATRLLTQRMPLTRLPVEKVRAHRELAAERDGGTVEVQTFATAGAELDNVADLLRRAHLEDGVPWGEMAVLVRAGARIPAVRRALTTAGVPLDIDGDDLPLRHEPALAPLLLALRVVAESVEGEEGVGLGDAEVGDAHLVGEAELGEAESGEAESGEAELGEAGAGGLEQASGGGRSEDGRSGDGQSRDGRSGDRQSGDGRLEDGQFEGHGSQGQESFDALSVVAQSSDSESEDSRSRVAQSPDSQSEEAPSRVAQSPDSQSEDSQSHDPRSTDPHTPDPEPSDPHTPRTPSIAPAWLDTETALTLLTSPLAGMDTADLRRLGRALREEERAAGHRLPPPSDELLARALAEPERLVAHDPAYARGAQRLGALLRKARERLAGGGTAEEALWELWNGTGWPGRLERAARRGGPAGRNADRDLDAVCALFATAARAEARTGGRGALNFLAEVQAQDIAADTLTRRAVRPDAVRLMTAHRAKGLQWRLVVVAGVQEGLWPDLRRRGSLLEADRIGRDGLAPPLTPGALLAEERRLFYVAATRASERLVVTAVKAPAEDGDRPSRFLTELGVEPREISGRPRRPLAVSALVAELRATTVDPRASAALRQAAAERLARLAALDDGEGRPLVPSAHPFRWWGVDEPTENKVPLRDRDRPLVLSGSALDQLAHTCALQWFLGREVKADTPATAAQGFGNVVHVLADEVASGRTPADLDVLMERLDSVWDALAFDAPWKSAQEKDNARLALERFLKWHVLDRTERVAVASEHGFDVTLEAGGVAVRIRGSMDRVERDGEGRAYVVDFKTGKQAPTAAEVARHPQLAVYQLAVREGAVDEVFDGSRPEPGGAELVHLRQGAARRDGGEELPRVQAQEALAGEWVGDLLATAAGKVLDERFTPTAGQHCTHCSFRASCSARPEGRQVVE